MACGKKTNSPTVWQVIRRLSVSLDPETAAHKVRHTYCKIFVVLEFVPLCGRLPIVAIGDINDVGRKLKWWE